MLSIYWLNYVNNKPLSNDYCNKRCKPSIVESIEVISRAMLSAQCDFSESVLRLKPLCEVLSLGFSRYSAMYSLYQVVENMPILAERKALKTNIRMKLDLIRETKEMELETQIKAECQQLLDDIKQLAIILT